MTAERQKSYAALMLALGASLEALRRVAGRDVPSEDLYAATNRALSKAGIDTAREKAMMTASPAVLGAAEAAFHALIGVRQAVRSGARLRTTEFHDAYHPYADTVWRLRLAIRHDLGGRKLTPADVNRTEWDGRETCQLCSGAASRPLGAVTAAGRATSAVPPPALAGSGGFRPGVNSSGVNGGAAPTILNAGDPPRANPFTGLPPEPGRRSGPPAGRGKTEEQQVYR